MKKLVLIATLFSSFIICAQLVEIKGEVYDEYLVPFGGAKIRTSKGKRTTSDSNGTFKLKVELPIQLFVKAEGFQRESIIVKDADEDVSLILKEGSKLDQVVMSATRTPERIFESPVSVTRLGLIDIIKTPSTNFYNGLEDVQGVTTYSGGVGVKMINTRGFTDMQNFRFVQMIDGVDNTFTQTNLAFGNNFGIADLDVESIEVLPGASSALYGPNAFNGVILINSKDPFEYNGIIAEIESGITTQESGNKPYYNPSVRMGYQFSDKFAAKVNFSFYSGEEWHASDYRNISDGVVTENSTRKTDYNGVNVYGEEKAHNLKLLAYKDFLINSDNYGPKYGKSIDRVSRLPNISIRETGYKEEDLTDNRFENKKFSTSLYYRPWGDNRLQVKLVSRFTLGDQFFQVSPSRYTVKDAYFRQHVLEFKGSNFMVRAFQTKTKRERLYDHIGTASLIMDERGAFSEWKEPYLDTFLEVYEAMASDVDSGQITEDDRIVKADGIARNKADNKYLLKPGTPAFNSAFNRVTSKLSTEGGSGKVSNSKIDQVEGNIDLGKYTDLVGALVGASYRNYEVDTKGTIFTDDDGPINVYEYGIYGQLKKSLLDERLKLLGTLRYDKSKNYEGRFSPRISANYVLGEDRNHNLRLSYQTALRNPTLENQYLGVQVGPFDFVIGNLPANLRRFDKQTANGFRVYEKSLNKTAFTASSYDSFINGMVADMTNNTGIFTIGDSVDDVVTKNAKLLEASKCFEEELVPEDVMAIEMGYRGMIYVSNKMVELGVNAYYNKYENLITKRKFYIPQNGDPAAGFDSDGYETVDLQDAYISIFNDTYASVITPVNSKGVVHSYGVLANVETKVFTDFDIAGSYSWTDYSFNEDDDLNFYPSFNTPKHTFKATFGNKSLFGPLGFNTSFRWQSEYKWHSAFADGLIDSRSVVDVQLSLFVPMLDSHFKLGANNILGKDYLTAIGAPHVGGRYFFSWVINSD